MKITQIYTEYQKEPLGIDEPFPRFSWILEGEEKDVHQTACRIVVASEQVICWDSGWRESSCSTGTVYEGETLRPCTRYECTVQLQLDTAGGPMEAEAETWFETGLMQADRSAWEGAKWIGAPGFHVYAPGRGVFCAETEFCFLKDTRRAGLVFGAQDERLLKKSGNEYGIAGENYIRYEINLGKKGECPVLDIYRVGYHPEDSDCVPFATVLLNDADGNWLLTEENKMEFHQLKVLVGGNWASACLDGVWIDGAETMGRTLNPRGCNDVLPYPRLNQIGFFAGEGEGALFRYYSLRNLRTPSAEFFRAVPTAQPQEIKRRNGEMRLFDLPVKDGCFLVSGGQITADPSYGAAPMLRTTFSIAEDKTLKHARLYISARGIYDCQVNGHPVTDRVLTPGVTQYDKRMEYQTYDLDELLAGQKSAAVGILLGSGWWCDGQTYTVQNYNYFGDRESVLCKIVLTYTDGSRSVSVSSPESWSFYGEGPYRYGGLFNGEVLDGRKTELYETYSLPEFIEENWEQPEEITPVFIDAFDPGFGRTWPAVNREEPVLVGEYDAPVYIVDSRRARSCTSPYPGVYIYDLEQEMAGSARITFHEARGTKIQIRYGEMLYPDLPEYRGKAGTLMVENYRDAVSTDVYICAGKEGGETWQPRLTFHGYRYIEVSGVTRKPELEEVIGLQYSSITDFIGSFESSNILLNRFAENVKWSQLCNFINIPTDCPQRNERMGWAGDTHVFCHTAVQNGYLKLFYERNLQAMADLQEENGRFPEIAPIGGGFGGITYECASIFMTWELYQQYGDLRWIQREYPNLKKYMDYMEKSGLPGRGDPAVVGPLADWLAFQETDEQLMWNLFYYREAVLMGKMAELLQKKEDVLRFQALSEKIRTFWNETFVDPLTGKTRTLDGAPCDTQCSYAMAIVYGIADDPKKMGEHLVCQIEKTGDTVGTGFFGTGLLNQALCETNHFEKAWKLMLQTKFPSWLYPVTQGATTIWEHWDSYTKERGFGGYNAMNSFNHYSLGNVLAWMYAWILGIQREEDAPGYRRFTLAPVPRALQNAGGRISTPYGAIESDWNVEDGEFRYECKIPANTEAEVILPDGTKKHVGSGRYHFRCKMEL